MKHFDLKILASMAVAGVMIGGAMAYAEEGDAPLGDQGAVAGITFPVAELGNCADKAACKAYCDDAANLDECVAFASSRGLMNKDESDKAKNFAKTIKGGGGPGKSAEHIAKMWPTSTNAWRSARSRD
jgi:hypothetical protein